MTVSVYAMHATCPVTLQHDVQYPRNLSTWHNAHGNSKQCKQMVRPCGRLLSNPYKFNWKKCLMYHRMQHIVGNRIPKSGSRHRILGFSRWDWKCNWKSMFLHKIIISAISFLIVYMSFEPSGLKNKTFLI